jgi:pilus assembly protein CpaB
MRSTTSLFVLIAALLMGGLAAFMARSWLASQSVNVVALPDGQIVVAKSALAFGATITADNVTEISWPSKTLPDGAFLSVDQLLQGGRREVLTPFVRNEPIVSSKVTAPNQRASLSTTIGDGKRAVTVAVDDVRGVAGFIFPGDYVDVVLTRINNGAGDKDFSEVILQHIKVLAIDQTSEERQDKPTVAKAVTVELTPEQSLKILLAASTGKLSLILRQSSEDAVAGDVRVTDVDLFGPQSDPPPPAAAPPAKVVQSDGPPPPPGVDPNVRTVNVVRSMKSQDYLVPRNTD